MNPYVIVAYLAGLIFVTVAVVVTLTPTVQPQGAVQDEFTFRLSVAVDPSVYVSLPESSLSFRDYVASYGSVEESFQNATAGFIDVTGLELEYIADAISFAQCQGQTSVHCETGTVDDGGVQFTNRVYYQRDNIFSLARNVDSSIVEQSIGNSAEINVVTQVLEYVMIIKSTDVDGIAARVLDDQDNLHDFAEVMGTLTIDLCYALQCVGGECVDGACVCDASHQGRFCENDISTPMPTRSPTIVVGVPTAFPTHYPTKHPTVRESTFHGLGMCVDENDNEFPSCRGIPSTDSCEDECWNSPGCIGYNKPSEFKENDECSLYYDSNTYLCPSFDWVVHEGTGTGSITGTKASVLISFDSVCRSIDKSS